MASAIIKILSGDVFLRFSSISFTSLDIKNSLNLENNGDTWFVKKENLYKHQRSIRYIDFELSDGGAIRVTCYEIIKGVRKNNDLNLLYS